MWYRTSFIKPKNFDSMAFLGLIRCHDENGVGSGFNEYAYSDRIDVACPNKDILVNALKKVLGEDCKITVNGVGVEPNNDDVF